MSAAEDDSCCCNSVDGCDCCCSCSMDIYDCYSMMISGKAVVNAAVICQVSQGVTEATCDSDCLME